MNRIDRRREAKLKRQQSFDIDQLRANDPNAIKAAIGAIDQHVREGRLLKARKLCAQALSARPDSADLNYAMGVIHQAQNNFDQAISSYQTAVSIEPKKVGGWVNIAICCRARRDYTAALKALDKAVEADPSSFHAYFNRGLVHCDRKDMPPALADLEKAAELGPDVPDVHFQLGFLRELAKQHDKAISSYGKYLKIDRNNPMVHTNLGACLQMVGDFTLGAEHLHTAIGLQPDNGRAHYLLACSDQAQTDPQTMSAIEQQLRRPDLPLAQRVYMHFAAARLCDRTGDYEQAFANYKAGNDLRGASYHFDRVAIGQLPDLLASAFPKDIFTRHKDVGDPTERPIFVVGMPRSGTTLVEQVIAAHPDAYGAGELSNLTAIGATPDVTYPNNVDDLTAEDISRMAGLYLADYPAASADARKVVDKTPGNALALGMIALMFPNARIIHCSRDPMDTCWSCYSQNFVSDIPYSCDFGNLAAFHGAHDRAMAHWRNVLPEPVLEVRYEQMIADPENAFRRIIEFCGLDWDARCLAFHEHDRAINTTSLWQVRKPLFTSSIGKWKKFETQLAPLKAALDDALSAPAQA